MFGKSIRRFVLATIVAAAFVAITAASAFADAGNPILGTITGNIVTHPDGTVTVYVRGQWNWYSHGSDCNVDRAGAGVGLIWKDPTETGFTVAKGSVSAEIGVKTKNGSWADPNSIDQTAHPADVGNVAEGYPGMAGQVFVDPPLDPATGLASAVLWKGGCGREPITATASPGPLAAADPSGKTCADGTLECGADKGHPWGSWGYQKQQTVDGTTYFGYSHTYRQRSDLTSVCVNFYDVHGALQVVKSGDSKEIDVDENGDNSIETNAFNVLDGANCISFPIAAPQLGTSASSATLTVGQTVTDTATVTGNSADGPVAGTIQFSTCGPNLAGNPTCTAANSTNLSGPVTVVNGQAQSVPYTPPLGHSCFRAVFTPTTSSYLGAEHTNQDVECFNVTPPPSSPAISITKKPDSQHVVSGGTATFTIAVKNTGNVTLTNVTVTDAQSPGCAKAIGTLTAGQETSYECARAGVTEGFTNVAVVTGQPPVGPPVTATDDAVVVVDHPAILITKAPATQTVISGGTATFTITVKNTGDVTLTNVVVTDAQSPGCAKAVGTLAVGESTSYSCTLANVTAGFTNVATVTAQPPVGPPVTSTDNVPVTVTPPPPPPTVPPAPAPRIDLAVTKSDSPDPLTVGGNLTYTMVVTNNGPSVATGVQAADPLPATTTFVSVATTKGACTGGAIISCSLGTMAVGESITITLVVKSTATGILTNTVTVVGNESETNTANNTATAPTVVNAPPTIPPTPKPPPTIPKPVCVAVVATPKQLTANGKYQTLNLVVTQAKKPVKGVRVTVKGTGAIVTSGKSNAKGKTSLKIRLKKAGVLLIKPQGNLTCNARVGVVGVFKPPIAG